MEVLCRDVMKRLRDDQTKRDPARKRSRAASRAESQNPTRSSATPVSNILGNEISNGISTLASQALASAPITSSEIGDMQIDPSLLQAANDPSSYSSNAQHEAGSAFEYMDPMLHSALLNTDVILQIRPHNDLPANTSRTWTEKLNSRTLEEIRQLVANRYPYSIVNKIEGVGKDEHGNDTSFGIDEDHELDAYLTHVHERKPLLVLTLQG
jgi:hypothetical protein